MFRDNFKPSPRFASVAIDFNTEFLLSDYEILHACFGMSLRFKPRHEPLRCLKIEMRGVMYRSIALYFHTQDGAPPHTNVKTPYLRLVVEYQTPHSPFARLHARLPSLLQVHDSVDRFRHPWSVPASHGSQIS